MNPTTALGDAPAFARLFIRLLVPLLLPFVKFLSTPKRATRVITDVVTNGSGQSGAYYDEHGHPMLGSALVRDRVFQDRVVAETRAFLANMPSSIQSKARAAG